MNLTFTFENEQYVAHFTANADFNIHIEKPKGLVYFAQSSVTDGEYSVIDNLRPIRWDNVIDVDCTALIYPKHIKIMSSVEPTLAVVTEKA